MHLFQMPFTRFGKLTSGVATAALIFSMTSCGTQVDPTSDPSQFFGLLINSDTSSNLLGGVRLESGESVSLYGKFNSDGSIKELEEVVYEDAAGETSSLQFVSGRPARAALADGSQLDITYEEVSSTRLKGVLEVKVGPSDETLVAPFEVDLEVAVMQLVQMVEDVTGGAVQLSGQSGAATTARLVSTAAGGKDIDSRQQLQIGVILFGAMIAGAGFLMVCSMAHMLDATLQVVQAAMRPVVIAIFAPLIIMGEICRLAAGRPWLSVNVTIQPSYLPPRHWG